MNSLLPPNASALERAVDAATARLGQVPLPLSALWDPDTCPASLLPWLAWSLSIDAWDSDWPDAMKREFIRQAIPTQRHKGSVDAVRRVVGSFGGDISLREWWQTAPPGPPHTFELVLNLSGQTGQPASAAFVDAVIAAVHRVKPVRSHFTFNLGLTAHAALHLAAGAVGASYRRLALTEALTEITHTLPLVPAARAVTSVRLALTETAP